MSLPPLADGAVLAQIARLEAAVEKERTRADDAEACIAGAFEEQARLEAEVAALRAENARYRTALEEYRAGADLHFGFCRQRRVHPYIRIEERSVLDEQLRAALAAQP